MVTTYRAITLEVARHAIKAYNDGTDTYGCLKNPDLDRQARDMFADGLGSTSDKLGFKREESARIVGVEKLKDKMAEKFWARLEKALKLNEQLTPPKSRE
jgi:hypothetical protein